MFNGKGRRSNRGALGQPATPQQVVTSKGRLDRSTIKTRKSAAGTSGGSGNIYPGGGLGDNHTIMPHDFTLMKKHASSTRRLRSHPNYLLLASFNGMDYGKYPSHEHVNRAFIFSGIALARDAFSGNSTDSGIATLIGGVYTINLTGRFKVHPGDLLMWNAPRLPNFGNTGVSRQEWNVGDPGGKRVPLIVPYRAMDTHTIIGGIYATIRRSSGAQSYPGISGAPLSQYYNETAGPSRKMRLNTSSQDEAFGFKFGLASQGLFFIFGLARQGLLDDNGPMDAGEAGRYIMKIATKLGLFDKNQTENKKANMMAVFDYMFGPHINEVRGNRWREVEQDFKNAFPQGFTGRGPKSTLNTLQSQLYRMAYDSLSMVVDTVAVGVTERRARMFGTAGNHAEPGQGVTVILGGL